MKTYCKSLLYTILLLLLFLKTQAQDAIKYSERPNGHNSPYRIPINEILASPDEYELTHIQVVGYLISDKKVDAIYVNTVDFKNHQYKRGLWIHLNQLKFPKAKKYNKHYVIIDAIFDANDHGSEGLWGGALKSITSLKLYHKK